MPLDIESHGIILLILKLFVNIKKAKMPTHTNNNNSNGTN